MPPISPVIMLAKRCMMNDVGALSFTTTVLVSVAVTDMIGAVGLTELALAALLFRALADVARPALRNVLRVEDTAVDRRNVVELDALAQLERHRRLVRRELPRLREVGLDLVRLGRLCLAGLVADQSS